MNPYFKAYLKNAAVGSMTGATLGMICGSGAGLAVLNQGVSYNMQLEENKSGLTASSALLGALTGVAIGGIIGGVAYPLYEIMLKRGFMSASNALESISVNSVAEILDGNRRLQV